MSNDQCPIKDQTPNDQWANGGSRSAALGIGHWAFVGHWSLVIGHCLISVAALGALIAPAAAEAPSPQPASVQVHLPRQVQVEGEAICLADVAVIHCDDAEVAARARGVSLGRSPWLREQLRIDRQTILGRLACSGIRVDRVRLTGAEQVDIVRKGQTLSARQIVAAAEEFLKNQATDPPGCSWRLAQKVEDLASDSVDEVKLCCRLEPAPPDHVRVAVAAVAGGKALAERSLLFRLLYPQRRVTARRDLPAGAKLSPEDVQIEDVTVERRPAEFTSPVGAVTAGPVRAGTEVRPEMVKAPAEPATVKREQAVVMRMARAGFRLTAAGVALQDGRPGQIIKVMNADTRRVVNARVGEDGAVEPVLEERP